MIAEKFGVEHNKVVNTIRNFISRLERIKVELSSTLKLKKYEPEFSETRILTFEKRVFEMDGGVRPAQIAGTSKLFSNCLSLLNKKADAPIIENIGLCIRNEL